MEELFLKMQDGIIPLNHDMISKYKLKEGTLSPFSNCRIVNKNGNFNMEKQEKTKKTIESQVADTVVFTTSEAIDIAQGVDSE